MATTEITNGRTEDGSDLIFRAVTARGKRRGIRLERIFWNMISAAAGAGGATLGDFVATAAQQTPPDGNLASVLRVRAAHWLRQRLDRFEAMTTDEALFAILQASPAPAFMLTGDKRIIRYNLAFLNYVQAGFVGADQAEVMRGLRLSLDTQVDTMVAALRNEPQTPVSTGFALGVVGRRVRGQLKAVLAPTPDKTIVIAFVSSA